jgi:GT2 family glycosyltransferase
LNQTHKGPEFVKEIEVPEASIIIVSFNTCDLLRECLLTLRRDASGVSYETIVIDNASHDGSAQMVAAEFPDARLVKSEVNLGFAAANNLGFEIARGRYLVLLNSDAFLRPGALRLSIDHMNSNQNVGLAGGRLVGRDDTLEPSARMFPSLLNELLVLSGIATKYRTSRFFGRADYTWADSASAAPVDWVSGAYCIIRRAVLNRTGVFDERFFFYYEEVDLCKRIKAAKNDVWYWPDIVTVHLGGESAKTMKTDNPSFIGSQLVMWRMRAKLLYYRKHHGALGVWSAMMLETWWNRLRALRNVMASSAESRSKILESKALVAMMRQAWVDTHHGTASPPRPW